MGKTFYKDLERGNRAELFILDRLKEKHPTLYKIKEKCIHYDLIDRDGYTVEVKYDIKSKETGNIAFEYKHRGYRAGISISKAKEWALVYYLRGIGWVWTLVNTRELRAFLVNNWDSLLKYTNPSDLDKSEIMLVNTKDIADTFGYYKVLDKGKGKG